ncbi:hypothetical protein [Roseibium sp.]|uniref:hypothetical protein n=1 Tax=Roseibium sp. TaxID=1936156 RepID=UPI003D09E1AA
MTLVLPIGQPDILDGNEDLLPLQHRVHRSIASHTEFGLDRIFTQDNRVKYSSGASRETAADHLDEVFRLMRALNREGLGTEDLGRLTMEGTSFRDALWQICAQIAENAAGSPLVYVELGPEPVKTGFIIRTLQAMGVRIDRYVAVDINPMSTAHMRPALEEILTGTRLDFVTTSFDAFRLNDVLKSDAPPALVTMLGFQEGNDDPFVVNGWLRDIARPGDLLLSESQLYNAGQIGKIPVFYAHPAMQRFSRIAFEQAVDRTAPTLNRFFLLPVVFRDGQTAQVAILGEEFSNAANGRNLHVSNYCLKLTLDQYRHYRSHGGHFEITGETLTDDQTLHFQLSRRL